MGAGRRRFCRNGIGTALACGRKIRVCTVVHAACLHKIIRGCRRIIRSDSLFRIGIPFVQRGGRPDFLFCEAGLQMHSLPWKKGGGVAGGVRGKGVLRIVCPVFGLCPHLRDQLSQDIFCGRNRYVPGRRNGAGTGEGVQNPYGRSERKSRRGTAKSAGGYDADL